MDRNQEYIKQLQEKNRIKKLMSEKSDDAIVKEELERGFSTHFRGAHSVKDSTSTSKTPVSSRPHVKLHTKAPSSDFLQRLMPPGLQAQSDWSPDLADGGVVRVEEDQGFDHSFPSSRSNYSEDNISDDQSQRSYEPYHHHSKPASQVLNTEAPKKISLVSNEAAVSYDVRASDNKVPDAMKSTDLNSLLMGHIQGLSAEQKIAMLQLLQHAGPAPEMEMKFNEESNKMVELIGDEKSDAPVEAIPNSVKTDRIEDGQFIVPAPVLLNVKIKIYSTWNGAKNVVLQGIRLRHGLEKGHVDVVHTLRAKVQSGLTILQPTTEPMRSIQLLIGQSPRINGTMWKASISSESPIEINFEGEVPSFASLAISNEYPSIDKTNFELFIWNGFTNGVLANCSPAKDVDVFVDNKCIWSGILPMENQVSDISRASDQLVTTPKYESTPSSRLKLISQGRIGTAPAKPAANITNFSLQSPSRKIVVVAQSPARIAAKVSASPKSTNSSVVVESEQIPEWLRGAKIVERKAAGILESPLRSSRKDEKEAEQSEADFGEFSNMKKGSPITNRTLKSRRRRARDASVPGEFDSPGGKTPKPLINYVTVDPRETESNLRKSVEAVEHAEKFNLNRLESTLLKRRPIQNEFGGESVEGGLSDRSESGNIQSATPPLLKSSSSSVLQASANGGSENELSHMHESPPTVVRSVKIDDVNAKLNTALTDLAEIMASLPKNRSEKKLKLISTNLTPDSGTVLQPLELPNDSVSKREELPSGRVMRLQIFSTYGDENYVGLNGIELYDEQGHLLTTGQKIASISAHPSDLTVLPGYEDDPRRVENLLDGINTTKDDLHQWLAPQMLIVREHHPSYKSFMFPDNDEEPLATVTIAFTTLQSVSMVRIFNFNKSRTHNQRGVKNCRLYLDNTQIFEGDIKRASGQMKISEADSQLLVFTKDSKILEQAPSPYEKFKIDDDVFEESMSSPNTRPKTAIKSGNDESSKIASILEDKPVRSPTDNFLNDLLSEVENIDKFSKGPSTRPNVNVGDSFNNNLTQESVRYVPSLGTDAALSMKQGIRSEEIVYSKPTSTSVVSEHKHITHVLSVSTKSIRIEFESSWGDKDYIGLTGIEVIGIDGKPIIVSSKSLTYDTSSDMFGTNSGDRNIENVINGINNTANDSFMWLAAVPFEKKKQYLELSFPSERIIIGLRFWNYNGNFDATMRGCKLCTLFFDDKPTIKYLLRPGPESDGVDFSQTLMFDQYFFDLEEQQKRFRPPITTYMTPKLKQSYEVVSPPTGLLWKFTFFNNHGDDYYIGLDAIELYDMDNQLVNIPRKGGHIVAVPHSVRDLSTSEADPLNKDPRIPERLFSKCLHNDNSSSTSKLCWLAPLARCMTDVEKDASVKRSVSMTKHADHTEYSKKKKSSNLPKDNVVMVMFSYPVTIAAIRIYNYSKSVRRGAKDFAIHVDGKLLVLSTLLRSDEEPKCLPDTRNVGRQLASVEQRGMGQALVFSQDIKIMNSHKDYISPIGVQDQDVLCINEKQVMVRSKTMYEPPNTSSIVLENPNTDFFKRPTTSFYS